MGRSDVTAPFLLTATVGEVEQAIRRRHGLTDGCLHWNGHILTDTKRSIPGTGELVFTEENYAATGSASAIAEIETQSVDGLSTSNQYVSGLVASSSIPGSQLGK
jgi:hypothetical protein